MAVTGMPNACVLALDTRAAFQHASRKVAFEQANTHLPSFAPDLHTWYPRPATHFWRDASGERHDITSTSGFDQGCPLAALAYALASRPLMEEVTAELQASG
eukprot:5706975-Alexandrium_andersonii.AAC.1